MNDFIFAMWKGWRKLKSWVEINVGQSIKDRAALQELPDKSQISGKKYRILFLETGKKESKKLKSFQKLLE